MTVADVRRAFAIARQPWPVDDFIVQMPSAEHARAIVDLARERGRLATHARGEVTIGRAS